MTYSQARWEKVTFRRGFMAVLLFKLNGWLSVYLWDLVCRSHSNLLCQATSIAETDLLSDSHLALRICSYSPNPLDVLRLATLFI